MYPLTARRVREMLDCQASAWADHPPASFVLALARALLALQDSVGGADLHLS